MSHRVFLLLAVCLLASSLSAQDSGMSEDYIRERAEARHARPYGVTLDIDLFGWIAGFDQQFRARSGNAGGSDTVSLAKDLDHPAISGFGSLEMNIRFSWHDSIHFQYSTGFTRGFGEFEKDTRWNGTIFPANSDADMEADWQDIALFYRRDFFRFGLDQQFNFYALVGIEYTPVSGSLSSDDFPVSQDSEQVNFDGLLPVGTLGVGLDWDIDNEWSANVQIRGSYVRGRGTLSEDDDGEEIRQDIVSIHAVVGGTWMVTDWFVLHGRLKARYLRVGLTSGHNFERFLFYGIGPELGIGFRF